MMHDHTLCVCSNIACCLAGGIRPRKRRQVKREYWRHRDKPTEGYGCNWCPAGHRASQGWTAEIVSFLRKLCNTSSCADPDWSWGPVNNNHKIAATRPVFAAVSKGRIFPQRPLVSASGRLATLHSCQRHPARKWDANFRPFFPSNPPPD